MAIKDIKQLIHQHEQLKADFGHFEDLVSDENWQQASEAWQNFFEQAHFLILDEEQDLYPLLEQSLSFPDTRSPFNILRIEHENLHQLMNELSTLVDKKQKGAILNSTDNFMIYLHDHFIRERNIITPLLKH